MSTAEKFNKRAVVSIALLILFVLLPITGTILATSKGNPGAYQFWDKLHTLSALLFFIFGIFHIINNWNAIKHYIKS
jgi:uncharacterized membrane protein